LSFPLFDRLPHGISVLDTGFVRPRFDAAYLIVQDGRAAIVDTGTNASVPRLLQALQAHGLAPEDVDWLIVTHIHLDHAGGAGLLLSQLPNARLVAHPRAVRHLADPAQLLAGVRAVYGEEAVARDYGALVPVPPQRIVASADDMVIELAGRPLRLLDTPGHARHHHCVWDEESGAVFAGDTLGVSYGVLRQADVHYALPSTTPVQLDPEALRTSIERLLALQPRLACITHYGAIDDVATQADLVLRQAEAMVRIARTVADPQALRRTLAELYFPEAQACELPMGREAFEALVAGDVELNALGLEAWRGS
jgi:glyoxylase-like metal-dependent hydrolase (beta-lactamase superfamily II)